MITKEQRIDRLRRHMDLKRSYEVQLGNATTDAEKKHLEGRIAEVASNIEATKPQEPKALLPKITKTAAEEASLPENRENRDVNNKDQKMLGPKRERTKIKKVENPF